MIRPALVIICTALTLSAATPALAGSNVFTARLTHTLKLDKARSWLQRAGRWRPPFMRPRLAPASCKLIPIGSDHAGYALKEQLKSELTRLGYKPLDVGTHSTASVDYPDFAHKVAGAISHGKARQGILVCGTGIGMSMAANKHRGVRAAVVWSPEIAEVTRKHNNANVLTLPSSQLTNEQATQILHRFLDTPFEGGRHLRRVQKIEK